MHVRLSQKGWLVIPAALRDKYGLKPGAVLQVVDYGGVLAIVPGLDDPIHQGAGMLKGDDSLSQVAIAEHLQELLRESG